MRPNLIRIIACLAALAFSLPHDAGAGSAGLTVTVAPDGTIRAAGTAPPGFPLRELRERAPGIEISATASPGEENEAAQRLLDALTIVLPRLADGEARLTEGLIEAVGTLHPGFDAEATRGAVRLALGSRQEARLDLAEAPPAAGLAITWSRQGAVASGILPAGLSPSEALPLLRQPVEGIVDAGLDGAGLDDAGLDDAKVTGGGSGDAAAWRAALPRVGQLLPAFSAAVVDIGAGRLSVHGALAPGHEAERLERWLAAALGEDWEVSVTGPGRPAGEGATRHDPVTDSVQHRVNGRWIPVHAFTPDPASCGRRSSAVLAGGSLSFVSGKTALAEDSAETLDRLAGLARRCLNEGGLSLEIGGHTDSDGPAEENLALSEARAMAVLLELASRGVRADAMRAVGHGETRAIAGNDSEAGRARNRRITFAWSE